MTDWVSFLFYSAEALLMVISVAYCLLILRFYIGWKKIRFTAEKKHANVKHLHDVSIVICCRNEEHNLPALIHALKAQTDQDFELVFVNDHSVDNTMKIMQDAQPFFRSAMIVNSISPGKKSSQKQGILASKSAYIITTDADCLPSSGWIATFKHFLAVKKSDLVIAPVKMYGGSSLFTKLQQLEFASLVSSGMGAAGAEMPVLCNAANMCFRKSAWVESMDEMRGDIASGDDIFLLLSIKSRKGRIDVLKSVEAMVVTGYSKTIKSFFKQRGRWLSKTPAYRDVDMIAVTAIVGLMNFVLITGLILSFFNPTVIVWLLIAFLVKLFADAAFLRTTLPFFGINWQPLHILSLAVLYPAYALIASTTALFRSRQPW